VSTRRRVSARRPRALTRATATASPPRLAIPAARGGKERVLTPTQFDVETRLSFDAKLIAFVTNERGSSVLRFYRPQGGKELPRPPLVDGVIGGLEWRNKSSEVGFHITSARSAGRRLLLRREGQQVTRWTNGNNPQLNASEFIEPRLVKWLSFDGREISGFHYHPPARFEGKRPVIINIHGGPEAQARPGFIGRNNYFVSELGVAMIYPNVRGSEASARPSSSSTTA
jgi:dipeptidyl aminopeptidase/acylaminoacyl peptidase